MDLEFKYEFNLILVTAFLPVQDSQGFYTDTLRATSGGVVPQLNFGGWEVIETDPFYEDLMTEEQKMDHGEDFKIKNEAKQLLISIRNRKGLINNIKIVKDGDKQSTLSK